MFLEVRTFAVLFELGNDALHKAEQRVFMSITVELVDNIISCINQTVGIQLTVNLCQPLYIPSDALP